MIPIPQELAIDRNREVLAYLSGASAHGDVATQLISASSTLGDVKTFCPDTSNYLYWLIYTRATIFGFATGMRTVAVRLDEEFLSRALTTGASKVPELDGWAAFELFRNDWPSVDLKFWVTRAYVQVREQYGEARPM